MPQVVFFGAAARRRDVLRGRRRCPGRVEQAGSQGTGTRRQGFEVFACTDHASFPRTHKQEKPRKNGRESLTRLPISPTRLGEEPIIITTLAWTPRSAVSRRSLTTRELWKV